MGQEVRLAEIWLADLLQELDLQAIIQQAVYYPQYSGYPGSSVSALLLWSTSSGSFHTFLACPLVGRSTARDVDEGSHGAPFKDSTQHLMSPTRIN